MCDSLKGFISQALYGSDPDLAPFPIELKESSRQDAGIVSKRPVKLWELSNHYHCPVIGTCLSVEELRKLVRQCGVEVEDDSDYALHSLFVSHASEANLLSRSAQKHLEKKYAIYRKRFAKITNSNALLQQWHEAWKQGDIAGAFWAVMTHPVANKVIRHEAYAKIHMLSHQVGSLQRADLRKLHQLEQREIELQARLKELQKSVTERDKRLQILQRELEEARWVARQQPKPADANNELQRQLQQAQLEIAKLREKTEKAPAQNAALQTQVTQLDARLQIEQAERAALEKHLEGLLAPSCRDCEMSDSEQCPASDMQGRCLLYVGGRNKLKAHFRTLVEQQYGGRFLHHDGGLHGKDQCLYQVLCQADLVFCPVDCISHHACQMVKQFCKKHHKPMVLLRSESLSAFTRGLQESLPITESMTAESSIVVGALRD